MLRLIELTYKVPMTEVEKYVAAHRDYLQLYFDQGYLIAAGPKDPRDGGIILAVGEIEFLNKMIEQDPYSKHNIADYKIKSFSPIKKSKSFEKLLSEMQN